MNAALPVDPGSVLLGYVHGNEVAHSWHLSLLDLVKWDSGHEGRVMRGGFLAMRHGTGGIVQARNDVALQFLTGTDAEWLFWIDTDMGFAPSTVDQLVASADPIERPVMGGLCFVSKEVELDGLGGFRVTPTPTLYRWSQIREDVSVFEPWKDYPRNEVVQVDATGSACILLHRSVMQAVFDEYATFYSRIPNPGIGQLLSEDLSLCVRMAALEIPIHADTSVKTTHFKPQWVQEADYDRASAQAAGGWQAEFQAAMR